MGHAGYAQQLADRPRKAAARGLLYDAAHETAIEGAVVSYTAEAPAPPIGAHLVLQTANGAIEVHLGPASYLQARHFTLAKGDFVRVVGTNAATPQGGIFLARVIQKGGESIVLRTTKGALLSLAGARALGLQKANQQALEQAGAR